MSLKYFYIQESTAQSIRLKNILETKVLCIRERYARKGQYLVDTNIRLCEPSEDLRVRRDT